ncbi:MAG: pyridoxamine 5'-phosphate oxidase family protein [Rhodospirillaceae bacterium]
MGNDAATATAKITDAMRKIVKDHRLGYVASVGADGLPNLLPKGTFVVVDGGSIAFAELPPPNTMKNIRTNPAVEGNFVDPFSRKGYRYRGKARFVGKTDDGFAGLRPLFDGWGDLAERISRIFVIDVDRPRC